MYLRNLESSRAKVQGEDIIEMMKSLALKESWGEQSKVDVAEH